MAFENITFVAAVNNRRTLQDNLLASPCFSSPEKHELLIQEGFTSAAKAYNDAIDRSANDLLIFVHQDILLPEKWLMELSDSLDYLSARDSNWGVLGCFGVTQDRMEHGCAYQAGMGMIGKPFAHPEPIQTLDEIVLILRKSSGLRFDETLPHFHLYGSDICLRAQSLGRTSYAIPALCIHNTNQNFLLPKEFYECYWRVRREWKSQLPVQASCIRITRFNFDLYKRKLYELYFRFIRHRNTESPRVQDVRELIREVESKSGRSSSSNFVV